MEAAFEDWQDFHAEDPRAASKARRRYGNMLSECGGYEKAIVQLEFSREGLHPPYTLYPDYAETEQDLARVNMRQGDYNTAIGRLKSSILSHNMALAYRPPWAWKDMADLAVCLVHLNATSEAAQHIEEAIKNRRIMFGTNKIWEAEFHCQLGNILLDGATPERALTQFQDAREYLSASTEKNQKLEIDIVQGLCMVELRRALPRTEDRLVRSTLAAAEKSLTEAIQKTVPLVGANVLLGI